MASEKDMDAVFLRLDTLLRAGDFASCNAVLEAMHRDCTSVDLLLSSLTVTLAAPKEKIRFRKRIAGKIAQILTVRNTPLLEIEQILDGLI